MHVRDFQDAIRGHGLEPPKVIEPGKIHRFPGAHKNPNNLAGWCLLFENGKGGVFGDWSTGLFETWYVNRNNNHSKIKRAVIAREMEAVKAKMKAERAARQMNRDCQEWQSLECKRTN